MQSPEFSDAVAPERSCSLATNGVRLVLHEWGDPEAAPVLLAHGMWDHARGFDRLAPRLAEHFRVLALDARGHGDSSWADAYAWGRDLADLASVIRWIGQPTHLVGHSKGGGQVMDAASWVPELVRQVVSIDGFGPPEEGFHPGEEKPIPELFADFLDRSQRAHARNGWRIYPGFDDLVQRRKAQNPRLNEDWLRYFVFHGAKPVGGGWTWKSDPLMARGFGPWRVEWIAPSWRQLRVPVLAIIGSEADTWGPLPEPLLAERLSHVASLQRATVNGVGHFVHMEQPAAVADLLLGFLERR